MLSSSKPFIIFFVLFIGGLIAFNIVNSKSSVTSSTVATENVTNSTSTVQNQAIADTPLGQQPKAIIDKATNQVNEINQLESEKLAQIDSMQ